MKHLATILATIVLMSNLSSLSAASVSSPSAQTHSTVQWTTNYDQAVAQSRETGKPIVVLFTGSDWCTWCTKLEREALNTADFARGAGDKFIFVKADFPQRSKLSPEVTAQNKKLKQQFHISSFPTVLIVDANGRVLGNTGYQEGGGARYADHLNKLSSK